MTKQRTRDEERAAIDRFFDRELMPLAKELKAQGVAFLDASPAPQAPSYYVNRTPRGTGVEALEWGGADSIEDLETALVEMWQLAAWRPLARLAPSIARLSGVLRRAEDESAEVSEFVYVMY